jgi:hypothetical protein
VRDLPQMRWVSLDLSMSHVRPRPRSLSLSSPPVARTGPGYFDGPSTRNQS